MASPRIPSRFSRRHFSRSFLSSKTELQSFRSIFDFCVHECERISLNHGGRQVGSDRPLEELHEKCTKEKTWRHFTPFSVIQIFLSLMIGR